MQVVIMILPTLPGRNSFGGERGDYNPHEPTTQ
jgi:hypothetical protein